jgi:hypothetical protein
MIKNIVTRSRKAHLALALAVGLTVTAAAPAAFATFVDATGGPTQVEYPNLLMIQYAGINYQITTSTLTCTGTGQPATVPGRDIDTIRFWNSLAQSALLAGKNMRIYYDDCTSGGFTAHYIGDLVLQK